MDKTRARMDTLCPYSKIKLTKMSLKTLLDKFPHLLIYDIYLYIHLHTYTILHIFTYSNDCFITVQNPYQ